MTQPEENDAGRIDKWLAQNGIRIVVFIALVILLSTVGTCWAAPVPTLKISRQDARATSGTESLPEPSKPLYLPIPSAYGADCSPDNQSMIFYFEFDESIPNGDYGIVINSVQDTTIHSLANAPTTHIEIAVPLYKVGSIVGDRTGAIPLRLYNRDSYTSNEINVDLPVCSPVEAIQQNTPTSTPNPDGVPAILNSQCVSKQQLMIVFQFEQDVVGQYEVFVNGVQYEQTPVDHPRRLFFFGWAPPGGGMPTIVLNSLPDQALVLEKTDYSVKQCDFQSPNNPNPGGDYVVPPPGPGE